MYLPRLLLAIALLFTLATAAQETPIPTLDELLAQEKTEEWLTKPYEYQDGKVDLATYRGWRQFHGVCHTCHGQDAIGSTFAPNLLGAFSDPELTYHKFVETVYNGRQAVAEGQQPMLAFGNNRDVIRNLDNLYAYLRARADGVLGIGRPQK